MTGKQQKKFVEMLRKAFVLEEEALIELQSKCYDSLPGRFNKGETETAKALLDIITVQTLNHANIVGDLLIKYEKISKKL